MFFFVAIGPSSCVDKSNSQLSFEDSIPNKIPYVFGFKLVDPEAPSCNLL